MNVLLFGAESEALRPALKRHAALNEVKANPDVIVCYGGDGTLLTAELQWPSIPKVPIRNSRRGHRMMPIPPETVIEGLAEGSLKESEFIKLRCIVRPPDTEEFRHRLLAMNEFNAHYGRANSAIRFRLWVDDEPFQEGAEFIGDGFLVATPFGSTAYYLQITRGIFYSGLGIAFKFTGELINHLVVPESAVIRAEITRGPATLAYDNAPDTVTLETGTNLVIDKDPNSARILTVNPMRRQSDEF